MRRNIFRWLQVVVVLTVLGMLFPLAGTMQGRSFERKNPVQPSSVTQQTVWPESATSTSVPILRNTVSVYLPLVFRDFPGSGQSEEWSQHAHNAQRTGYTPQTVPYPWRWRWSWNGPNARGGVAKVTTNGSLPRNVQPITGGGRVYIAAGVDGVFALSEANG